MTRSELVNALTKRQKHLLKRDVELAVACILEQMITVLINNERIEVRGFGSFNIHHLPARMGRNPKTGEALNLPPKSDIHFKPGKEIRDRVNAARDKYKITK